MSRTGCGSAGARPTASDLARRIAEASLKEAALDISLKPGADAQALGGAARRPRAADRLDPAGRARPHRGPAGLRRGRLVGAGRGRRARRAGGGRRGGAHGRRSVRRAGRQDGGAGGSRCHRDRRRCLAEAARAPAREPAAARPCRPRWLPPTRRPGRRSAPSTSVILDAPCTATGTIRRHPDILRLKRPGGRRTAWPICSAPCWPTPPAWCGRAGILVYSTCSLEPEEGEHQIAAFLGGRPDFGRVPIAAGRAGRRPSLDHRRRRSENAALPLGAGTAGAVRHRRLLCRAAAAAHVNALVHRSPTLFGVTRPWREPQPAAKRASWTCPSSAPESSRRTRCVRLRPSGPRRSMIAARERIGLAALAIERARRGTLARMRRSRLLRWRHRAPVADDLLLAPPDLRPQDPSFADEIESGSFGLSGLTAQSAGTLAVRRAAAEPGLGARAARLRLAAPSRCRVEPGERDDCARSWWPSGSGGRRRHAAHAWAPEVVGRRIISWLSHAALILDGAERRPYAAIMLSLEDQVTYLSASWRNAPDGYPQAAGPDRAGAGRSVHRRPRAPARRSRNGTLVDELERQILADGGHISRNPSVAGGAAARPAAAAAMLHRARPDARPGAARRHRRA